MAVIMISELPGAGPEFVDVARQQALFDKSYKCQSTSSYQVTCTDCSPGTASIIASVPALAGRPG